MERFKYGLEETKDMHRGCGVYVSGTEESKEIAKLLGFPIKLFNPALIKNQRIILVCGDGYEHQMSHKVSKAIKCEFSKIVIDAHHDIKRKEVIDSASHVRYSVESIKKLKNLYMSGYKDRYYGELSVFAREQAEAGKVRFEQKLGYLNEIKGEILHASLDLDVLKGCGFCSEEFKRNERNIEEETYGMYDFYEGPTLGEVLAVMSVVKQNNDVIALDICGLDIRQATKNNAAKGVDAYRKTIDLFLN
ncbi:hypothetical protein HYU07_05275 [Candidatus Woesearchaeota archaeon]|nr:hypothetical protein [Candidatus Woesearchaeota archaeon]